MYFYFMLLFSFYALRLKLYNKSFTACEKYIHKSLYNNVRDFYINTPYLVYIVVNVVTFYHFIFFNIFFLFWWLLCFFFFQHLKMYSAPRYFLKTCYTFHLLIFIIFFISNQQKIYK